jgi:hypothetical protein
MAKWGALKSGSLNGFSDTNLEIPSGTEIIPGFLMLILLRPAKRLGIF